MMLAQGHEMRQKGNRTCKADIQTPPQTQSWTQSWVPLWHSESGDKGFKMLMLWYVIHTSFQANPIIEKTCCYVLETQPEMHSHNAAHTSERSWKNPPHHLMITYRPTYSLHARDSFIHSTPHAHHQKQANQTKIPAKFTHQWYNNDSAWSSQVSE